MGQIHPARVRAPALAPAPALALALAPARNFTLAPDLGSVPPVIQEIMRSMLYKGFNIEQRSVLLTDTKKCTTGNNISDNADLFCDIWMRLSVNPQIIGKIPVEQQELYRTILEKISFVASYLSRNPINPRSRYFVHHFYTKETKKERSRITKFFSTGHETLVRLCFVEIVTIVPERPWTDEDAALFLRTLESIDPVFSRLFTEVFDDLIDQQELREHFSKKGEYYPRYSKHPQFFSASVFKALSKVVRPKPYLSDNPETIVHGYGLKYHYRYPHVKPTTF